MGATSKDEPIRSCVTTLTERSGRLVLALELQHESNVHYNLSADLRLDNKKCCCQ